MFSLAEQCIPLTLGFFLGGIKRIKRGVMKRKKKTKTNTTDI